MLGAPADYVVSTFCFEVHDDVAGCGFEIAEAFLALNVDAGGGFAIDSKHDV
jgi:hypothetical protein